MAKISNKNKAITPNLASAILVISALILPVWIGISTLSSLNRVDAVEDGRLDATAFAQELLSQPTVRRPEQWVATARALSTEGPDEVALAISLLDRALVKTETDYQSWALLAFLHRQADGRYSETVDVALRNSITACPYCSKSLLRWRFTFILDNWPAVPEETRLLVFSGADFLRWWHLDYEYLDQVRTDAIARRIPFDEYRRKIDTPARPNEIGLDRD